MRDWTEIVVDEELLIQVVQELLVMADSPNHVEVAHGTAGRVILAEAALAERWYQSTLNREPVATSTTETEVELAIEEVAEAPLEMPVGLETEERAFQVVEVPVLATGESVQETPDLVPLPVKRGPGRPRKVTSTSASNGEES